MLDSHENLVDFELERFSRAWRGARDTVHAAGFEWVGVQETGDGEPLYLFNDPKTGSTITLCSSDFSPEAMQNSVKESRDRYGIKEA